MKGCQGVQQNFANGFSEKNLFRANGSFWAQKWYIHWIQIRIPFKDFFVLFFLLLFFCFWILHNERGQEMYRNYITQKWYVVVALDQLWQFFFLKFCTMKRVNSYMKIMLMVFLKKLSLAQLGHFWIQNNMLLQLWICCIFFFYFEQWKGPKGNIYMLTSVVITTYSVLRIFIANKKWG